MRTRAFRAALAMTVIAVCQPAASQERAPRTVITIHWSADYFPSTPVLDEAIREVLLSDPGRPVNYFVEYLESDRIPEPVASESLRDYIRRKYEGRHIDLVLAVSDPAYAFVRRYRDELFPGAPVVFSVATPSSPETRDASATGVVRADSFVETLDLALRLHPETTRVFVIARSPEPSYAARIAAKLAPVSARANLTFMKEDTVPALLAAVKTVPAGSLILYIRYSQETPGNPIFPDAAARMVAEVSPVPVYATNDSYMGKGVVGGVMRSIHESGMHIGGLARQILEGGMSPSDIPVQQSHLFTIFDWRQMRRWGIDPGALPAGADVRFKVPTVWESYAVYIVSAAVLLAAQAFTIAALVAQRARRRESEARRAAILRAVPDMMFLLTREGVYLDYHAPSRTGLLVPPETFLGKNMREVLPPRVAATFEDHFARIDTGASPEVFEYAMQMPDGERHFEARIVPSSDREMLAVVRDITDRTRAAASLVESRERYALATAAGRVGVWVWDIRRDEVFVDETNIDLLGYDKASVGSRFEDWLRHVHPGDAPILLRRVRDLLEGISTSYEMEHRWLHRDGGIRWFLSRGSAVLHNGETERIVGTYTDITEFKQSEHAVHEVQAELARVSRRTVLGELAGSIAHELRQPLTAIIVNASTCLRWFGDRNIEPAEYRSALEDLVSDAKRADEVIRRTNELFRHHTIRKEPVNVSAIVVETAAIARMRLVVGRVTLNLSLADDLPRVLGDRVQLQQVLINLIVNGIEAMERVDPVERRLTVVSRSSGDDQVEVLVTDNGVGLEGVDMKHLFKSSYTTKPSGTGVGLWISRSIIEAHGGRLWAESNSEGGATFRFALPGCREGAPQPTALAVAGNRATT